MSPDSRRVVHAAGGASVLAGAATAVLAAISIAATVTSTVPVLVPFASWVGVALVTLALMVGRAGPVGWGIGLVTAAWAISIAARPDGSAATLDPAPLLVAPGLLVAAELAYWSLDPGTRAAGAPLAGAAVARRATDLAAAALATAAGVGVVLIVARTASGSGLGLEAVGVTAVLLLLAAIVGLAGRELTSPR